jgi:hypothetical protein
VKIAPPLSAESREILAVIVPSFAGTGDFRQEVIESYAGREDLRSTSKSMRWLVDATLGEFQNDTDVRQVLDSLDGLADDIYRRTALWSCSDPSLAELCATTMNDHGLMPILGTPRLARGMALLGLADGFDPRRASVAAVFADHGLDLEWTLAELRRCDDQYGFPPPPLNLGTMIKTVI